MENKKLLLILIVLIPICLGLFIYGNGLYKEDHTYKGNDNYDKIDEEEDETNISDKEVKELINFIFNNNENMYLETGSDFDNYFYKNIKLDVSNIKMSDRLAIVANYINKDKITLDEMTDAYNKIFGDNIKIEPMKFTTICKSYTYDNINSVFNLSKDGLCGNSDMNNYSMSLVYDVEKEDTVINVYEYYVKVKTLDNKTTYYSDYEGTKEIIINENDTLTMDDLVDKYSDKLGVYKYTFNLDNDNYIFTSVEKVK